MSERTPELVLVLLVGVLAAGALLLRGGGDAASSPSGAGANAPVTRAHVALVARRVEQLRGLRFRHPVPVAVVTPAQARREGLAEFDRSEAPAQRRTDEEVLKLLGLLPAGADLREVESTVFGEQVAGYYDPRRKRLALVRGAGVDDVTLAHELTHALEDQHVDLDTLERARGDDASAAAQALVEGSATLVMERYAERWPSPTPLGDALAGLTATTSGKPLPAYAMRELIFPYTQGEAFVQALRDADAGGWKLVDVAEAKRPPQTTAEILAPARWLRARQPANVTLDRPVPPRTEGWRRRTGSTLGAEDLAALLAPQSGPLAARELTAGWEGGRYALWRRGPLPAKGCPAPCRARDALLLGLRMATPAQARALGAALGLWVRQGLHAQLDGGAAGCWRLPGGSELDGGGAGRWRLPGGSAAVVASHGAQVRVALAPSARLAARLAG